MITIERLNLRGEGVAGNVTVPRSLPGEAVDGEIVDGRIASARILTPSSDRVSAACRHYRTCGGCALMHASEPFTAAWKQSVVIQALKAQGLEAEVLPAITSPPASRRRATFAGRRLKSGAMVGFHGRASETLTAVPECHVLDPALVGTLPALHDLVVEGGSRSAQMRLTVTRFDEGVEVVVDGGKPLDRALRDRLPAIAARRGLVRLVWGAEVLVQQTPPTLVFGRARVSPPPGAFLQATPQGEAALIALVQGIVGEARRVADLFAGCGTFALPLAETAEVHAVEGAAPLLAALALGWRNAPGLKRVSTETRDLFRRPLLPDELARFDAIVIDPPRAGAEAQVAELRRCKVPRVAHVSCNPVTFAREARSLVSAGYRLGPVHVVDQFRWSSHIELVAGFFRH